MSQLRLYNTQASWLLNVMSFSSPLTANFNSVQVKKMQHHFPIKVSQNDLQLSVMFSSEKDFESFQRFVRAHQQDAIATGRLVTLNWPERNINNWTGIIRKFVAGNQRFNYAPRAQFNVDLVDSMVSQRTELAAVGANLWQSIFGVGMGPDAILAPPSVDENAILRDQFGIDQNGSTTDQIGTSVINQPGFGPSGVVTGN